MFRGRQIYRSKDRATPQKGESSLEEVLESHGLATPAPLHPSFLHTPSAGTVHTGAHPATACGVPLPGTRCGPVPRSPPPPSTDPWPAPTKHGGNQEKVAFKLSEKNA